MAPCSDDLVPGVPLGGWGDVSVVDPAKSRGHRACRLGTACLLVGSAFLLFGIANPPGAWMLDMVAGLVVRVAFLLFGVAALLLGVECLLGRWPLVGVPFLLIGVAALLGGVAALLEGWTLVGVALILGAGHGTAARVRSPAGQMGTGWDPIPAGRGRGPAERHCGLAGRMDTNGASRFCYLGSRSCWVVPRPC